MIFPAKYWCIDPPELHFCRLLAYFRDRGGERLEGACAKSVGVEKL